MTIAREVADPHQPQANRWRFENGRLFHQDRGRPWVEVKRVSFTPQRHLAIAALIAGAEVHAPTVALHDALDMLDRLEQDLGPGEHHSWRRQGIAGIRAYILGDSA